jgi:hypothetical protein
MKRALLLLPLVAALTGCGSVNALMESWEGNEARDLVVAWGPPTQVYSDGKGGAVLVYVFTDTWTTPAHSDTRTTAQATAVDSNGGPTAWEIKSQTVYTPERVYQYSKWRAFWVNSQGIIYSWQWRGL